MTVARGVVVAAGCAAALVACTSTAAPAPTGTVSVHVGLFGGPPRPGGGMALSDAPQPNAPITLTGRDGHTTTSRTGADGVATFAVAAGRYVVSSTSCGYGAHHITVRAGVRTRVEIRCAVP